MLKFQAWDGRRMWTDITGFECSQGAVEGIFLDGDYHNIAEEEIMIRRFTGLIDKNGKEIYEGDVFSDEYGTFQVWWNEKMGVWAISDSDGVAEWLGDYAESYEVIGNIYQDRHLLPELPC